MTDLYTILQVHRDAEPEVIRAAHRALARKHHPDFGGDAKRMAAINLAWSVLGNPARRARYDAGPQAVAGAASPDTPSPASPTTGSTEPGAGGGVPVTPPAREHRGRRLSEQRGGGTVLDFGRYKGWSVGTLADQDPNYLPWLARTPIGRRLTAEIDAALGLRTAEAAALRPQPVSTPRRGGLFAGLGTIRTASR